MLSVNARLDPGCYWDQFASPIDSKIAIQNLFKKSEFVPPDNFTSLLANENIARQMACCLQYLDTMDLSSQENLKVVCNNPDFSYLIVIGLGSLKEAVHSRQLTDGKYASFIYAGLIYLQKAFLLSPNNFDAFLTEMKSGYSPHQKFEYLCLAGLLSAPTLNALVGLPSPTICVALKNLLQKNILTLGNLKAIIASNPHFFEMLISVCYLQDAGILWPVNRDALLVSPAHASIIARGQIQLDEKKILTMPNRAALLANPAHADEIATVLTFLEAAEILNHENREALIQKSFQITSILYAIFYLGDNLDQDSYTALLADPVHAQTVAKGTVLLKDCEIFNIENRTALLIKPALADKIAQTLVILHDGELLEMYRDALATNRVHLAPILSGIIRLFELRLLIPKNVDELFLEQGAHAQLILQRMMQNVMNQDQFEAMVQTIKIEERAPSHVTAMILSHLTRSNKGLPHELNGHVAAFLSPAHPGAPNYDVLATKASEKMEQLATTILSKRPLSN